jgi:hypothetical protein
MASGWSQTIKRWDFVAASPFARDSCQVVSNQEQLSAALTPAGWTKQKQMSHIHWDRRVVLLTSADQTSKPGGVGLSPDGTKAVVALVHTDQRNSGVFLLEIEGQLGSSNTCAVLRLATDAGVLKSKSTSVTSAR